MIPRLNFPLAASALLLLAGCAAGPDYQRPALTLPNRYTADDQQLAVRLQTQQQIRQNWWNVFGSPELDGLIEQAWQHNASIASAQANLRAAQENVAAQRGYFYPTAQLGYSPSRTKLAGNQGGNSPGVQGNGSVISTTQNTPASQGGTAPYNAPVIYNFHTAQLSVAYTPDVFGANRRQLESVQAQQEYQSYQLQAAYLTLASNLVAAAIQDGLLRELLELDQQIVAAAQRTLALVQRQQQAGYASAIELASARNALALAQQALPPLRRQLEQNRDLLRLLTGLSVEQELPAFRLASFRLPHELPLALPSQLLEQRPDIRAAEAQLKAASAQVGVARAARLPQFTMTANAGGAASEFSQMFWNSGKFFALGASITQTLFDGATLQHRERAADASLQAAAADYRSAVATALQNVADVLHAIDSDVAAVQSAADAASAAQATLQLCQRQHAAGALDQTALLLAQQNQWQSQQQLAQARASQLGNAAALYQALGGSWQSPQRSKE